MVLSKLDKMLMIAPLVFAVVWSMNSEGVQIQGSGKMIHPIQKEIDQIVQVEWSKTSVQSKRNVLRWLYQITPPLPASWPVQPTSAITSYFYAKGRDLNASDGECVTAAWGKVEYIVGNPKSLHFTRLSTQVEDLGVQGIRPITAEEDGILVKDWMSALHGNFKTLAESVETSRHLDQITHKRLCLWFKLNGVITEELRKKYISSLYDSLGCSS